MAPSRFAYAAATLLAAGSLPAQESGRPGEPSLPEEPAGPANSAVTLFDRSRNTFNWAGRISLDTSALATRIHFRQLYSANIILLEGSASSPAQRLKSSQHTLALRVSRPFAGPLSALADLSSLMYTDDKAVGISSASTHILSGGVAWDPSPLISVTPLAGYRWDDQGKLRDHGPHYALTGRTRDLLLDGYRFGADLHLQEDRLNPRILENHGARATVERTFEGRTRDSLDLAVARTRREFYAPSDTLRGVDSRTENIFTFANLLDYDISREFLASLYVSVYTRGLQRDTRSAGLLPAPAVFGSAIDEFRLETFVESRYSGGDGTEGFLKLFYGERTESHEARPPEGSPPGLERQFDERNTQEQTKNNSTRRTVASGMFDWPVGRSDTLHVAGSGSILRYDTPSRENTEDRDEQLFALTIASSHRLARSLLLTLALEGTMSHTVYLLGERSANNNRNRVLRFSPRTLYRPSPWLLSANGFEVLANYTVYDFEEQSALVKSFSYRQFSWHDSTAVEITDRVGLDFLGSLKFYERGQLNWGEFTERTENSFTDRLLSLQLRWSPAAGMIFAAGYRSFTQWRYSFGDRGKVLDNVLESVGPTVAILWDAGSYGSVGLLGWYERWSQSTGAARSLANLSLNVQLKF
jgi:hypothetical protein